MIILGVLTKFGAVLVTIPGPIVGGVYFTMFGKFLWPILHKLPSSFEYYWLDGLVWFSFMLFNDTWSQ